MRTLLLPLSLAATLAVATPAMASPIYAPVGPQTNVALNTVTGGGWTLCYSAPYGQNGPSVASAVANCTGDLMMLAGGASTSQTLSLLAWAPKADVMFDTGASNTPHNANGTGWYFNGGVSWGFAPQGAAINRADCDIVESSFNALGPTSPFRLCWHTSGGNMNGGWRVGIVDSLNQSTAFTKYIFTASSSPSAVPEPGSVVLLGTGLAVAARYLRKRVA